MDPREEYLKQTEARVLKLGSDLTMIRVRLEQSKLEARLEDDQPVKELSTRYTRARDKLQRLKEAGKSSWSNHQTELEEDLVELQRSINDVGMWVYTRSAR